MAYIGKSPSQAVRNRYFFTASGGETSISSSQISGFSFSDGAYTDVYLNGVLLVAGTDYNTNTANTIAGLSALVASDIVEIVVYDTFSVFGGTFNGTIDTTGLNVGSSTAVTAILDEDNMASDSATSLATQQSIKAYVDTQVATVPVGDITEVTAGTGLTGGGASGAVTLNVVGGTGITANADDIAIDATVATLTGTQTLTNKTLGATSVTADVSFGDNDKAIFGAGSDLQIYHSGSASFIRDTGTGSLQIEGENAIYLANNGGTELYAAFNVNGASSLYHDNSAKIYTQSHGARIDGGLRFASSGAASDTANPYIFRASGVDSMVFATGSAERMRLDSSGNLLIGKTADNVATVGIEARATGPLISTRDGADALRLNRLSSDGEIIQLRKDGTTVGTIGTQNWGIGTASPSFGTTSSAGLEIAHATRGIIRLEGNNQAQALELYGDSTGGTIDARGSGAALQFDLGGTERMRIDSSGRVGIGTSSPAATLTVSHASGTDGRGIRLVNSSNNQTYETRIGTQGIENTSYSIKDMTAGAVRFSIDSNGNVGIGTSSPSSYNSGSNNLVVGGSSGDNGITIATGAAGGGLLAFADGTTGNAAYRGYIQYDHNADFLAIGSSGSERMRIDSSGNVGIGTTSPNNNSGRTTLTINNASQGGALDLEHNGTVVGKFICDGANTLGIQADGNKDILFKTNGNSRMLLSGSGNVYFNQVSTSSPGLNNTTQGAVISDTGRLFSSVNGAWSLFNRNTDNGAVVLFRRSGSSVGEISVTLSSTTYSTSSDHRLKENVADMTGAIARVKALAPKRFNFIVDADTTVDGFLAHEAQTVVPEAVTGTHNGLETWTQREIDDGEAPDGTSAGDNKLDEDGNTIPEIQGIDQSKLVPLLTGALQEAIAKIETLETQRADLETRLTTLENA